MKTIPTSHLSFVTLIAVGTSVLNAQLIDSDNFNDGDRAGWFAAQTSGTGSGFTANASSNALVFNPAADALSSYLFTYFPSTTLATGQKLTASFDFSVSTARNASDAFRLGLLNSADTTQLTADGSASNPAFTGGYDGYSVRTNIGVSGTNRVQFRSHDNLVGTHPLIVTNPNNAAVGALAGTAHVLANSTVYNATFGIERGVSNTFVSFTITGPGISGFESTQTVALGASTFDTFVLGSAIGTSTTPFDSIALDNWAVSVSSIPEPSTYTALAAVIAIGFAAGRRRRRQAE